MLVFLIRMVLLRTISCLSTNFDPCDLQSIAFTSTLPSAIGKQVFLTVGLQRGRTRPLKYILQPQASWRLIIQNSHCKKEKYLRGQVAENLPDFNDRCCQKHYRSLVLTFVILFTKLEDERIHFDK